MNRSFTCSVQLHLLTRGQPLAVDLCVFQQAGEFVLLVQPPFTRSSRSPWEARTWGEGSACTSLGTCAC